MLDAGNIWPTYKIHEKMLGTADVTRDDKVHHFRGSGRLAWHRRAHRFAILRQLLDRTTRLAALMDNRVSFIIAKGSRFNTLRASVPISLGAPRQP
jgi:hypothetical protein